MKIRTEIKRTDVFTIQIDEQSWDKEGYSRTIGKPFNLTEVCEQLAFSIMRFGSNTAFHEGFGNVAMFKDGVQIFHYEGGKKLKGKDYAPGIIVHILDEDDEFEYETEVIK